MHQATIDQIKSNCLSSEIEFRYLRDQYALMLLTYFVQDCLSLGAIKKSPLAPLLDKPLLKAVAARVSDGKFTDWTLRQICDELVARCDPFILTFGKWGQNADYGRDDWYQTSRPGWNLVVQLNFPKSHERAYRQLMGSSDTHLFNFGCHPVSESQLTLAWARVDIDYFKGEALIEEIQSDWVKTAAELKRDILDLWSDGEDGYCALERPMGSSVTPAGVFHYLDQVLGPIGRMWDEAMLAATIWVLRNRLRIGRIYYHSYESGDTLKNLAGGAPRSLYERLPRRFCFSRTHQPPDMLLRCNNSHTRYHVQSGKLWWYIHELPAA